jgi:Pregnancy-associated plasma protein-A
MKKLLGLLLGGALLFSACKKNDTIDNGTTPEDDFAGGRVSERHCAAEDVFQEQRKTNPALQKQRDDLEAFTNRFIQTNGASRLLANGIIEIPVVFNVLYKTATQNISDAQLQSQIDVLNEDFATTNADYSLTPSIFQGVRSGDVGVRFVLDRIVRQYSSKNSWSTNDAMKRASTGGIDADAPTTKLNIWVVNKMTSAGRTILGYAQFPGGPAATDGVVLGYNFTGRVGVLSAPFNLGRTATHEVGHWLNLRHIWGDATCGTDLVGDTPTHNTSNGGCPTYPHLSTCSGNPVEMTMNYMDYTNDVCMYMFSAGQKTRMLAVFAAGGPRNSFAQP